MMGEHGHREPGRAADLDGVGVTGADAKMLGKDGRQHDVRRDGGVAAEDAVDLGALEPGIIECGLRGLLIRSSEDEPSCLPKGVRPTPVMKLMGAPASSFRGGERVTPSRTMASISSAE